MTGKREFFLPLGITHNGKICREGTMRHVTTGDELELQTHEEAGQRPRYRDILLLSRVVEEIKGIGPLTPALIEELYEADFLYLQLLYREVNDEAKPHAVCPKCAGVVSVSFARLYETMDAYQADSAQGGGVK